MRGGGRGRGGGRSSFIRRPDFPEALEIYRPRPEWPVRAFSAFPSIEAYTTIGDQST
jgi:hypothetical protein